MNGPLEWVQIFQHGLLALIAWVSIGVYGSFYVIRSLASPRARRRTHEQIHKETYPDAYPEEPPRMALQEPRRLALDAAPGDDRVPPELFEDIEVPQSWKELRLSTLFICGLFGPIAVLGLAFLGWVGSSRWRIREFVARRLLTGGPDWSA